MNPNPCLFFLISLISLPCLATLQTASPHHPENFIESLKDDPKAGEKVYTAFCAVCHDPDPQIPLGAPRIGISEDWKARHHTREAMMKSVFEGLNAMPARGGCFECSDELLKAAVQYMISDFLR